MTDKNRNKMFRFRGSLRFNDTYSIWVGTCLETGHIVTADDHKTARDMLVELLDDETAFALKHKSLRNLLSNPAPLDEWEWTLLGELTTITSDNYELQLATAMKSLGGSHDSRSACSTR